MSYHERITLDTLLYKEDERTCIERSTNTGLKDEMKHSPGPVEKQHKQKVKNWCPFSGHLSKFKFPIKSLRDLPDDTPQQKRKKFGIRLAYWAALSSGGSS